MNSQVHSSHFLLICIFRVLCVMMHYVLAVARLACPAKWPANWMLLDVRESNIKHHFAALF